MLLSEKQQELRSKYIHELNTIPKLECARHEDCKTAGDTIIPNIASALHKLEAWSRTGLPEGYTLHRAVVDVVDYWDEHDAARCKHCEQTLRPYRKTWGKVVSVMEDMNPEECLRCVQADHSSLDCTHENDENYMYAFDYSVFNSTDMAP